MLISTPPANLEITKQESVCLSKMRSVLKSCEFTVCVMWRVCLQRETLLRQLETNQLDIEAMLEELSVQQETEDQNYDMWV